MTFCVIFWLSVAEMPSTVILLLVSPSPIAKLVVVILANSLELRVKSLAVAPNPISPPSETTILKSAVPVSTAPFNSISSAFRLKVLSWVSRV